MTTKGQGFQTVKITEIEPWPGLNPRLGFDLASLKELADSIRVDGLLQPVAIAPVAGKATSTPNRAPSKGVKYWLFAGERRLRACQILATHRKRLKTAAPQTIDVIVHDVDEATAHRLAGIENLDRNDLTAVEEAIWLQRELQLTGNSQKELGEELGRSQAWVANRIRLLALPAAIRKLVHGGVVAPAMVRDTLLRFTKLEKADQSKLWKMIAREVKRAAKDTSPVLLTGLRGAVVTALREAGAVEIREGYHYHSSSNAQYRISDASFKAFKKAHPTRCIQAASSSWRGEETFYTFAVTEWQELIDAAQEVARSTRSTGGVSKKKLANPKLGPTSAPIDQHKLQQEYGYDNVIAFDKIVDPSKIEPSNVVRVEKYDGKTELTYVGPNVRALKGARTRAKTPIRAEVVEKVQTGRMDKGAALTATQVLTGLLEAVVETNFSSTLKGMIEAELGHEVELSRYRTGEAQIAGLKIPAKSLKRIAAGLAHVAIAKVSYWDLDGAVEKAVEKRVSRDSAKGRKAWLAEHAPKEGK